ncbi:MAG TPA: mechanosensitive ion channel family protein [Gemmatimonadaceae bacterium]
MLAILLEVVVILGLLLLNGAFAISKLTVMTARRVLLKHRAEKGDAGARALELAHDAFLSAVQSPAGQRRSRPEMMAGCRYAMAATPDLRQVIAVPPPWTRMRRRGTLLSWLLLTALALPLHAQRSSDRVTVRVDGRPVLRVGPADSADATERARRIERRIATMLESPRAVRPARIERSGPGGRDRMISVAGVPVVTVTPSDADDNVTTLDALAAQWAGAIDIALARAAERRLSRWGRFGAEVQASVGAAFSRMAESAIRIVPRVLAALLVLALFWALAAGVRRLLRAVFRRTIDDLTVENLFKQLAYYAIWAIGLLLAVDALGFQPQTVVTGLGLTGLALGFALKDIISNFVSGVLLLALRPFELGDQIVVGDTEGAVERIRLRATDIRTYDGRLVLVPNGEIFTSRVTNNTASPIRRAVVTLPLGYDSDVPKALVVAREAVAGIAGVLAEPAPTVRVAELGMDDLMLEARFWTDSRRSDYTATQAAVREAIVAGFKGVGLGLPDPDARFLEPRRVERWREALGRAPAGDGDGAPDRC